MTKQRAVAGEQGPTQTGGRRNLKIGLGLAAIVIALDQLSKWWILEIVMSPPKVITFAPFFNLVLTFNRGVSFGLFGSDGDTGRWILTGLAAAISAALTVWLWRIERRIGAMALGLIIGGALGNVIDRVHIGAVVDFLDFHAFGYHWPAFNVADSAITIGAALLIFESLFERENES